MSDLSAFSQCCNMSHSEVAGGNVCCSLWPSSSCKAIRTSCSSRLDSDFTSSSLTLLGRLEYLKDSVTSTGFLPCLWYIMNDVQRFCRFLLLHRFLIMTQSSVLIDVTVNEMLWLFTKYDLLDVTSEIRMMLYKTIFLIQSYQKCFAYSLSLLSTNELIEQQVSRYFICSNDCNMCEFQIMIQEKWSVMAPKSWHISKQFNHS